MFQSTVHVHLPVLAANVRAIRSALGGRTELVLVVKADAYGHGARRVARAAWDEGVRWFAVAHLHEALELREALPAARIVMLGVLDPADAAAAHAADVTPILASVAHAALLSAAAVSAGFRLRVHAKVDTGMGRLGLPAGDAGAWAESLLALPGIGIEGACSHFAAVEPHKPELAAAQHTRFREVADRLERLAGRPLFKHMSSSRAFQYHPEWDLDAVRPGILAYGYGSSDPASRVRTTPCLEWKARLVEVKPVPADSPIGYYGTFRTRHATDIGILCIGYADGLHRTLSNRGYVLAGGARRPLVGRISMNWAAVDLGPRSACRMGDEVVLIGRQGNQVLWADEVARWASTIAYEILTAINPRAPRVWAG